MPDKLDQERPGTSLKTVLLTIVALGAVLVLAIWFAWAGWNSVGAVTHAEITAHGYIALGLGVGLSLLLGGGLMALVFYSARHGHDDVDHEI